VSGMAIQLSFSEYARSPSRGQAIRIAQECGGIVERERYQVTFDAVTPEFKKLLSICGPWKATELYIDNMECNIPDVLRFFNCYAAHRCEGICECNERNQRYPYDRIVRSIEWAIDNSGRVYGYRTGWDEFDEFVQKIDESTFVVDKEKLLKAILEDSRIPLAMCDKCTEERISKRIRALPENLNLNDESEPSNIRIFRRSFHIDDEPEDENDEDDGLSHYDIARYTAIAEIMAPILAREIAKEFSKLYRSPKGSTDS